MTRKTLFAAALGFAMALSSQAALAEGDAEAGKKVYKKCKACHAIKAGKNKVGPSMAGIMGRAAATADGFKKYSKAMKAYGAGGAVWDDATMDAFLTKPKTAVKGTKMAFPGLKKEKQRADVIAYLKTLTE
jgi:cytochrome c